MERADVRMIQARDDLRFAREALTTIRIVGQMCRQRLDGDDAIQADIEGAIHLTHAAGGDERLDFVRTEGAADEPARHCRLPEPANGAGQRTVDGRLFDEVRRTQSTVDERLDFAAQREVGATGAAQECRALGGIAFERLVIEPLDLPPSSASHFFSNSRSSQAFASPQSRATVTADTLRTSAVSSTVSPPKKRSSTILLLRASNAARVVSASSSATRSADGWREMPIASSSGT